MRLLALMLALVAGAVLGWLYFKMLWSTVRQMTRLTRPGWWMAAMLALRLSLAACAFVLIARWAGSPALLAALAGFMIVRVVYTRQARVPTAPERSR